MKTKSKESLVNVEIENRALKICYIVPYEQNECNLILDAIFEESYSRWGGFYTLIIPSTAENFYKDEYEQWLAFYDPDLIYTYIDLSKEMITKLDRLCLPMKFLRHQLGPHKRNDYRDYFPKFDFIFPVRSISTLTTPQADFYPGYGIHSPDVKTLITQHDTNDERFIKDNFGCSIDIHVPPNPRAGLFETLCYTKESLGNLHVGTTVTDSLTEVLDSLIKGKVTTVSKLSYIFSESIPKVEFYQWSKFIIFVGESNLDRIHFWNSRSLARSSITHPSLIISKDKLEDPHLLLKILEYTSHFNTFRDSNNSYIELMSFSENIAVLEQAQVKFNQQKKHSVSLDKKNFNRFVFPSSHDFFSNLRNKDAYTIKVDKANNEIAANFPLHFKFLPVKFFELSQGQWALDINIERENSYSKYVNVKDVWNLPRRRNACKAFTREIAKVNKSFQLSLLTAFEMDLFRNSNKESKATFNLKIPSDITFFKYMTLNFPESSNDDLRSVLTFEKFDDLDISDKGQNLRGIISMFDSFSESFEILTKKMWRSILRKNENKESIGYNQLFGYIPTHSNFKSKVAERFHLPNVSKVVKYLEANFDDTLEYLVEKKIFFQVHKWRCTFCGNSNVISIDELRKENNCSICSLKYYSPIKFDWEYRLNTFVTRTLCERHSYPVLWAIGYLYNLADLRSFYYLPEVDFFFKSLDRKMAEIDILCVVEGRFVAAEVKKTAFQLTSKRDELFKFKEKILKIRPDIAYVFCETYIDETQSELDGDSVRDEFQKIIKDLNTDLYPIKVKAVVACEEQSYVEDSVEIGYEGQRTMKILSY